MLEIPAKLIERIESLAESKLNVALALTKMKYDKYNKPLEEKEIMTTYMAFYEMLKDIHLTPIDEPDKHPSKTISYYNTIIWVITGIILVSFLIYLFFTL